MFTGPIVARLAKDNPALFQAFQMVAFMVAADPFYMEPVRKWAFAATMLLHDAEKVRLGTMRDFVARDGLEVRKRTVCRNMTALIDGYDKIKDCTGTIQTIFDAANQARVDVMKALSTQSFA